MTGPCACTAGVRSRMRSGDSSAQYAWSDGRAVGPRLLVAGEDPGSCNDPHVHYGPLLLVCRRWPSSGSRLRRIGGRGRCSPDVPDLIPQFSLRICLTACAAALRRSCISRMAFETWFSMAAGKLRPQLRPGFATIRRSPRPRHGRRLHSFSAEGALDAMLSLAPSPSQTLTCACKYIMRWMLLIRPGKARTHTALHIVGLLSRSPDRIKQGAP